MPPGLQVVFEDEHCLAVVKPAGQLTQGSWAPPGETTLEDDVRRRLAPDDPGGAYVGIVHRLDRPVSGILIWGKHSKAARRLASQFEKRLTIKEYWAIIEHEEEARSTGSEGAVASIFPSTEECWEDWLLRPDQAGLVRTSSAGDARARRAVTRVLNDKGERLPDGASWLRLWPETGRTHQLRVQAGIRGTPIFGDAVYGSRRPFSPGIALHARSLQVRHPTQGTPLVLVAPLPERWEEQGIMIGNGSLDTG